MGILMDFVGISWGLYNGMQQPTMGKWGYFDGLHVFLFLWGMVIHKHRTPRSDFFFDVSNDETTPSFQIRCLYMEVSQNHPN
jgi:hypothetical protein